MKIILNKELLEEVLSEYIEQVESGSIYEDGYPESELIPTNHKEVSEECFLDYVIQEVSEAVEEILNEYFAKSLSERYDKEW